MAIEFGERPYEPAEGHSKHAQVASADRIAAVVAVPAVQALNNFTFNLITVDSSRVGKENVVALAQDGDFYVSGTDGISGTDGNLWHGVTSFAYQSVPTTGGGDATIHSSTDGDLVFAELGGSSLTTEVAYKPVGGSWTKASQSFNYHDRPWFASKTGKIFLIATKLESQSPHDVEKVVAYNSTDGGASWNSMPDVVSGNQRGNLPQMITSGGQLRVVVPIFDGTSSPPQLKVAIDNGNGWDLETVGGVGTPSPHPSSAVDSAGNLYIAWREGNAVKFSVRTGPNTWSGSYQVASPDGAAYGSAIVAGGTGKLDFAWYQKDTSTSDWHVHFRQVTGATTTPTNDTDVDVDWVLLSTQSAGQLGDFLSVTKDASGNGVVAYAVKPNSLFAVPHPHVGEQASGPTI